MGFTPHQRAADERDFPVPAASTMPVDDATDDLHPAWVEKRNTLLLDTLGRLPFNGLVQWEMPDTGKTDDLIICAIIDWLSVYRHVVQEKTEDFTRQAQVMRKMQDERAMVRAFFGLPTQDYS